MEPSESISIFPGLVTLLIALATVFAVMIIDARKGKYAALTAILGLVLTSACAVPIFRDASLTNKPISLWNGIYTADPLSLAMTIIFCLTGAISLYISATSTQKPAVPPSRQAILTILSIIGACAACSAKELITIFLSLELMSLPLFALAAAYASSGALHSGDASTNSCEAQNLENKNARLAGIICSLFASALILFGISLIFGTAGTTFFDQIGANYVLVSAPRHAFVIGALLILCSLCLKASAAPFHMWLHNTITYAPSHISMLLATIPQTSCCCVIIRLFWGALALQGMDFRLEDTWIAIFSSLAILSIMWGSFAAIKETSLKGLLASLCTAQTGWVLLGAASSAKCGEGGSGAGSAFFCMAAYCVASVAAWMTIALCESNNREPVSLGAGLGKKSPFSALVLAISLLSLAGMPPFAGASGRFLVLRSYCAALPDKWWAAALAAMFSIAAAGSCLRFIISIYTNYNQEQTSQEAYFSFKPLTRVIAAMLIIVAAGAGLYPEAMRLALEAGSAVMALPPSP